MNEHFITPLPCGLLCLWACSFGLGLNCFSIVFNCRNKSPSDNLNDRWKRLCFVSWATAPCIWTLRTQTINLLTYLLTKEITSTSLFSLKTYRHFLSAKHHILY